MGRRLLSILRVILEGGLDALESAEDRGRIEQKLLAKGFRRDEVSQAFDWLERARRQDDPPGRKDTMLTSSSGRGLGAAASNHASVLTLSERAYHFLNSLRDLGLVDDDMEEEVLNRLMMTSSGEIGLEDMKRTAAVVIFERQFDMNEDYYGIFEEEWKLLFN